ncbi:MAG: acetyl-CoA carboxylase biotin carboxyl carrier protein [Mariprofundaceae bacterium]
MDISQIRKLIKLIQSTDVNEIEVSENGQSVRICRNTGGQVMAAPVVQHVAPAPHLAAAPAQAEAEEAEFDSEHAVFSPMVGTFYRSASPESDAYVSEGLRVKKGDVLCIIEAMKLMNEIEAEYDGVVEKILAENAQPIEYGQPLFVIKPL